MQLKIDEEFRSLIPPLTAEEFQQLRENILQDGCRDALITWNSTIVDGHNRYQICRENDIPFKIIAKTFNDRSEAIEWIILNQFGRRNLTPFQRSQLALRLKPLIQEKAKERQGARNDLNITQKSAEGSVKRNETRDELAKLAGVSHDTIEKTEKILKDGTPEQIKRAKEGGKGNSVNAIFNEIKDKLEENSDTPGTKVCSKCKQTLSIYDFYPGKGQCKRCHDSNKLPKDLKGNTLRIDPALKDIKEEDVIGGLYDTERVIEYDIDDLIADFQVNFNTSFDMLGGILKQNRELIISSQENNKKIMAVLSEAVAAMANMKGEYLL